jgi:hypothetical protein
MCRVLRSDVVRVGNGKWQKDGNRKYTYKCIGCTAKQGEAAFVLSPAEGIKEYLLQKKLWTCT